MEKANKIVYSKLVSGKTILPIQTQKKWVEDCNMDDVCINWKKSYQLDWELGTSENFSLNVSSPDVHSFTAFYKQKIILAFFAILG